MSRPDPLDARPRTIEPCEPRWALSASLGSDSLFDWLSDSPFNPTDSPFNPTDGLHQSESLASQGLDGSGQTIAVIDSGIAWDHIALGGGFGPGYRVVGGWDFAENDATPYDDGPAGYHGSHVAGILAGHSDGFRGVAPGADLVSLRVFDDHGNGDLDWIESALQWVHEHHQDFEHPITTVNLSVGASLVGHQHDEAMAIIGDELHQLRQDNILVFAAAGNQYSGDDRLMFPASSESVVAVTSHDAEGNLSEFAQRKSGVFSAKGESIKSSVPDHVFGWDGNVDDFAELDGTSMATPQVAGASVLVRQAMIAEGLDPNADEVLARMHETSLAYTDASTGIEFRQIDLPSATDSDNFANQFHGTNQSEQLVLDLRHQAMLIQGDASYPLAATESSHVIDAAGGEDRLRIIGSDSVERLIARASNDQPSQLVWGSQTFELRGFEMIQFDGGGGNDRATLFDSDGDDTLKSHPSHATLSGTGYEFSVSGVSRIYVHGTAGGTDTAFLHDSVGDDELAVRPQFTSLRSDDSFQLAYGFERVYAYASMGGHDSAELGDSAGDDTMSISSDRAIIAGAGFQVSARGFDSVIGHANAGGEDIARLYADSSGRWDSAPDRIQWIGEDLTIRLARGFERTAVFEDYQPIEIDIQSQDRADDLWMRDIADPERQQREAESIRRVFEFFGDS